MYSVVQYGDMACDGPRVGAYAAAIARAVRPGSVVVDLGAGTGVFSLLAARAGARIVHAVETSPEVHLLTELARENGFADRIVVHQCSGMDLELEERADVLVSDLRGSFPLHGRHLALVHDAKQRLLESNGCLIPVQDRLVVALADGGELLQLLRRAADGFERLGFRASAALDSVFNSMHIDHRAPLSASNLLSKAEPWGTLSYGDAPPSFVEGDAQLVTEREGDAHGLAIWFEATLLDGIGFTNAPGFRGVHGRVFLPFTKPLRLAAGARVGVSLRVDGTGEQWAWNTTLAEGARVTELRQATFLGAPASADAFLRLASSSVPKPSVEGRRTRAILEHMDGRQTISEIGNALLASERQMTQENLLAEIRRVVQRYAR